DEVVVIEAALLCLRTRNSSKAPFCSRDLSRSPADRRPDRHHLISEWHFVFQIAAIQRFGPNDGCRLIRTPTDSPRPFLNASERHTFARRHIGNLACELIGARPNFNLLRKTIHRNQMRERSLDSRDEKEFATR